MSFLGSPTTPPSEEPVSNDGWFPDIDLTHLRATARLDGTVTRERLRAAALAAIASVNDELAEFKFGHALAGRASLAEVPASQVGGHSVLVVRYQRAVYAAVQADLIERYRDFDTTGAGDKAAEKLELRVDELRREMRWAICDIRGLRRTTVELI